MVQITVLVIWEWEVKNSRAKEGDMEVLVVDALM